MNTDNNAAQTLFRLVGLRSPQLTITQRENLGFIYRPDKEGMEGFFDNVLKEWSTASGINKFAALEVAAKDFIVPQGFKTEKSLEAEYPNLAKLGKRIARKEVITEAFIAKANTEWGTKTQGENEVVLVNELRTLWDNLIYQIVTQKDFHVKEVITQIIKAIHYLDADSLVQNEDTIKINGTDFRAKATTAVIVFPDVLVKHEAVSNQGRAFTVNESEIGDDSIKYPLHRDLSAMEQNQLAHIANIEHTVSNSLHDKEAAQTLKAEILKIQADYSASYRKAYSQQYSTYDASIQPEISRYERDMNAVRATFTEQTTEAEQIAAYQTVEPLNIEPFAFEYPNELDLLALKEKLTTESFAEFMEMFTDHGEDLENFINQNPNTDISIQVTSSTTASVNGFDLTVSPAYNNFETVLNKLDNVVSDNLSKALTLKPLPEKKFANIGGALIPISDRVSTFANSYYVRIVARNSFLFNRNSYLQFGFLVEDNSWSVSSIKVKILSGGTITQETFNNIAVAEGKISIPEIQLRSNTGIDQLFIQIWFDNGCEGSIQLSAIANRGSADGVLTIIRSQVNTDAPTNASVAFQPKHFGVKRLGVADYLKVEQSIHAYVPGEVSNIENVMASELKHKSSTSRESSEITTTTSKTEESEKMSDTVKTSRSDMQSEVARELQKEQSYEAHTRFGRSGTWFFEAGGSYANNNSRHDSTRLAVEKSKEITDRALDRVLTKVSEERVEKIIKEYTETNVHEFDNRGKVIATNGAETRPQHITGVYRWVDKKMKNQIYNYGKRMMFEFMIPEPARLHALGTKSVKTLVTEPLDPRKAPFPHMMANANVDESMLTYWAEYYNVSLDALKKTSQVIYSPKGSPQNEDDAIYQNEPFEIPEDYVGKSYTIVWSTVKKDPKSLFHTNYSKIKFSNLEGGFYEYRDTPMTMNGTEVKNGLNLYGSIVFHISGHNIAEYSFDIKVDCVLSDEFMTEWKKEQFAKIIAAYEEAYQKFREEQETINEEAVQKEKENNERAAIFYRSIESNILKHNCIAYLLQSYNTLGQEMSTDDGKTMASFNMNFNDNLDQYTALAKFMEQAFEWTIMDYTFYPYYWANRNRWQEIYMSEEMNPLFRSFLQAGMARVIVTVKPGFEDPVQFFINTGRIWNGGEVPVIGDPMYLSIVDELRAPTGVSQGKYWITRVPTTLTILQAKSVGLEVEDALPIFPEDNPENCENPAELETESAFGTPVDAVMASLPGTTSTLG